MGYVHSLLASTVCVHLLPELATGYSNHNRSCCSSSLTFCPRNNNRHMSVTLATQSDLAVPPHNKPQIELQFIGPKPDADGNYPLDRVIALSGDKLLRSIMQDSKIELYAPYGKVMNCGGGGTCGTCIVEIIDGKDLLNERTNTELRYLKKKPESWRLACQTIVGDKENSGKVVVQRLPQWKK